VLSVLQVLRKEIPVPISVDTTRAPVARAAVEAGADLVNDISGATLPGYVADCSSVECPAC